MKLILNIPWPLIPYFEKYSDVEMILLDLFNIKEYKEYYKKPKEKERWVGFIQSETSSFKDSTIIEAIYEFQPDYVFTPYSERSTSNINTVTKFVRDVEKENLKVNLISTWAGALWEIPILKQISIVGIPYFYYRDKVLNEIDTKECHFFGYKHKLELNRLSPISLNTSVPIRAAALGIDLRTRHRRPKGLPPFNPNQRLNFKEQVDLTISNINFIKEGL